MIVLIILLSLLIPLGSSSQSFMKVYSGTKSEIRKIVITGSREGYFMTDNIFMLDTNEWKKMEFPDSRKTTNFFPLSSDDIWYCTGLENSTSILYHLHEGIIENVRLPFANLISSIYFPSENLGFFSGFSEVAVWSNGAFAGVHPLPAGDYIKKVRGWSPDEFYVLDQKDELFIFKENKYQLLLPGTRVKDFHFIKPGHGYILSGNAVYEMKGTGLYKIIENEEIINATKIFISDENDIWLIGISGLILHFQEAKLENLSYNCTENLTDLAFTPDHEIWISGEGGLLLYRGNKTFKGYAESNAGFSAHKPIFYGIYADNEYGVAIADFNADQKPDIFAVCIYNPNRLYINQIDLTSGRSIESSFSQEGSERGASGVIKEKILGRPPDLKLGVAVADVDNDGDQDIYLPSLNYRNNLLLNKGNGYFRNVSNSDCRACDDMDRSNMAAFADVDLDGDLDLFATSEKASNRLYLNDGTGHFRDVTESAGLASKGGGMCASFSDVNDDRLPDLCVSFWYPQNKIYLNETRNGTVKFRDITGLTDLAGAPPAKSNAVVFADINNDGLSDLFIANRNSPNKLYLNDGNGIFKDVSLKYFESKTYLSNGAVFADFDLDGYQDLYVTNVGENVLYRNIQGKYFEDVTGMFGAELNGYCTGCATGDIDGDGDIDLYAANYTGGSSMLFINKLDKRNTVTFKLQGTRSNRDAIGAKVYLYINNPASGKDSLAGFLEISGGSGYGSASSKEAIFGLTPGYNYYAKVVFPYNGITIIKTGLEPGTVIPVIEEDGLTGKYTIFRNAFIRFFKDRETRPEIIKYLLVMMLLFIYLRMNLKGPPFIRTLRWVAVIMLFALFIGINQVFLFHNSRVLFFVSPVLVLLGLVMIHLYSERTLLKRLAEREKQELREKLSSDLHDDLASTLGSISIYSETLKNAERSPVKDYHALAAKISDLTRSALQSITDIIWMTTPRNDSLQQLLSKTNTLMYEILTDNQVRYSSELKIPEKEIILSDKLRNDLFLILKEALHNIISHAEAKNVRLTAYLQDRSCEIRLNDDGCGFSEANLEMSSSHGNGLINMRRRAVESKIELKLDSKPGQGTRLRLVFQI